VGHPPAVFARYPWLKPQFNQAAFRGLKAPAPSGKTGAGAKAGICGRKGWRVGVGASLSGSFAALRMTSEKQATAGPSTSFGASAPNSAQDDSFVG